MGWLLMKKMAPFLPGCLAHQARSQKATKKDTENRTRRRLAYDELSHPYRILCGLLTGLLPSTGPTSARDALPATRVAGGCHWAERESRRDGKSNDVRQSPRTL